jgi:hypothetical protein
MDIPNGNNGVKKNEQSVQMSSTAGNESTQDSLHNSIHSSDGSLQISDDEADHSAVATTRLNTWLNGGSNEVPLQLGTGTISSTTPVNPFVASNNLPSPFSIKPSNNRYTAPPMEISNIRLESRNTSTRSRMPPSPPKTIGTSNNNIVQNSVPSPLDEVKKTSFNSVAVIDSTQDSKKLDATTGRKETIQGEPFRYLNVNASSITAYSPSDQVTGKTDIPPKPHHQHHRSVSWGEKQETTIPPKAPKLSPKLSPVPSRHHRGPSEFSLFSVLTQTDSEGSPRNIRSDSSRIIVNDLVQMNPLETEAETLILRVLEAQENNARQRANTGHSGILVNVPDDAAHIFLPQIETLSSKSGGTGAATNEQQGSCDPSNRPRSNTVEFVSAATNTVTSTMASSPPAGATAPIQSNQRPSRPNLTRNATVEHKLANLTETLAGYHNKTAENTLANNTLNQRTEIEEAHNADVSAGEKLAKNANLIYRGRQKTEGKKIEKLPDEKVYEGDHDATKSSHWPKIRAVTSAIQTKVNEATNQTSAAVPSTSNHSIPMAQGSVEERKKMDVTSNDVEQAHPGDSMESGTAMSHMDDNQMKLNENSGHGKNGRRWRVFQKVPIINSRAARDFRSFAGQRRSDLCTYLRFMVVVVFPALATALVLFHFAGK